MTKPEPLPTATRYLTRHAFRTLVYGRNGEKGLFSETSFPYRELASLLGMKLPNLYGLMNGQRFPRKSTVELIARRLNMPYQEIADKLVVNTRYDLFLIGKDVQRIEPPEIEEMLTASEVAARLRTLTQRVSELCRSGKLKASRVGSQWRITQHALDAYLRTTGKARPQPERMAPWTR